MPARDHKGRTVWVTRSRPKIDRIACPWLIRRFVDPQAVFLFVDPAEVQAVADRFQAVPFDVENVFSAPCSPPPGLTRTLVFLQDNERDFMRGVGAGLEQAARDRKLDFRVALAANDDAQMRRQAETENAKKSGAFVVAPINPRSMTPVTQRLLWSGAYVGGLCRRPPHDPQRAAISDWQGARRSCCRLHQEHTGWPSKGCTSDTRQQPVPGASLCWHTRHVGGVAGCDNRSGCLAAHRGPAGGFTIMQTILLAQPTVDVVLGADTVVLGALDALRAAQKDRTDQFLGGIDGEPEAVAEIKAHGPYKASVSLASPIFGYALGQFAADWLEGKSVPQAMDILPKALDAGNIAQYEANSADPGGVYSDPVRRGSYLRMYGNICYDSRETYLNFPWSSER